VRADLGDDVALVLDGGPATVGVESTIVDLTVNPPMILRRGAIPASEIEDMIGKISDAPSGEARAPGMLEAHYAPVARVELVEASALEARAKTLFQQGARVATLALGKGPYSFARHLDVGDTEETFAQALYARLRDADAHRVDVVLAVPPEGEGLGEAIADRLRRAAASSRDDLTDES
jgi:L-threonylcarbamoyladenylate synthase